MSATIAANQSENNLAEKTKTHKASTTSSYSEKRESVISTKMKQKSFEGIDPSIGKNKVFTSLSFSKNNLFFKSEPNKIAFDCVAIKNIGTTCIYFKWQKSSKGYKLQEKKGDGIDKFFCHYSDSKLSPNESKEFTFSFFAERNGCFSEDWVLLTSPQVKNINLNLHLNGVCLKMVDSYSMKVKQFDEQIEKNAVKTMINELVLELVSTIKHTEPALPKMSNPLEFNYYFLTLNQKYNVEASSYIQSIFVEFSNNLISQPELKGMNLNWGGSIEELKYWIGLLKGKSDEKFIEFTFQLECIIHLSRFKTFEDSPLNDVLRNALNGLGLDLGDEINTIREEFLLHPLIFDYLTRKSIGVDKDLEKFNSEMKKKIDEFYKKVKKKPFKNKEEEEAELRACKAKVFDKVKSLILDKIQSIEKKDLKLKRDFLVMRGNKFSNEFINNSLAKIDNIKQLKSLEGQICILRLDLQDAVIDFEYDANVTSSKDKRVAKINKINDAEKIFKSIETLNNLRAKLVVVLVDFGPKNAIVNPDLSTRHIQEYLQRENTFDQIIYDFDSNLDGLSLVNERLQEETPDQKYPNLKENSILFIENINFIPEECGFEYFELPKSSANLNISNINESHASDSHERTITNRSDKDKSKSMDISISKKNNPQNQNQPLSNNNLVTSNSEIHNADGNYERIKLNYYTKTKFIKKICQNFSIFVNDSINSIYQKHPTVIDMICPKRVLGSRLEEQISKLNNFFVINSKNFLFVIGSDFNTPTHEDLLSTLLIINTVMNKFKSIMLLGKIGLLFLLLIQNDFILEEERAISQDLIDLMKYIIVRAQLQDIELILPEDFRCIPMTEFNRFMGTDNNYYKEIMDQASNRVDNPEDPLNGYISNINNFKLKDNEKFDPTEESKLNEYYGNSVDYISYYQDVFKMLDKREKRLRLINEANTGEDEEENLEQKALALKPDELQRLSILKASSIPFPIDVRGKMLDFFNSQNVQLPTKMLKNEREELAFYESIYYKPTVLPQQLMKSIHKNEMSNIPLNDAVRTEIKGGTLKTKLSTNQIPLAGVESSRGQKVSKQNDKDIAALNSGKHSQAQGSMFKEINNISMQNESVLIIPEEKPQVIKSVIPEGHSLVDYGELTYKTLNSKISQANCIFWLGEIFPTKIMNIYDDFTSIVETLNSRKKACEKELEEIQEDKKMDQVKAKKFLTTVLLKSNKTYEMIKAAKKSILYSDLEEDGEDQVDNERITTETNYLIDYYLDDKLKVIDKLLTGESIPGLFGLTQSDSIQIEEEELDLKFLDEI